jgi:putative transposase
MARQARLFVPGCAHLIGLPALQGVDPCPSPDDRAALWQVLGAIASSAPLRLHAAALLPTEVRLLATPDDEAGLSAFVQAVGRRYVSAYNRCRGRTGTIWAGRFRAAAVAPGECTLQALRHVDGASGEPDRTGARQRCGGPRQWPLADPPEYWALGNTPFERERAYASLLAEPLPETVVARLGRALSGGWPFGDEAFLRKVEARHVRPARPRPRGRPATTSRSSS